MRILNLDGIEVTPDESLGYLQNETIIIQHHDAIEAVEAQWHYEVIKEYPNGGKDLQKVIDVPGVQAVDAWDETENILRWIPYTEEELTERAAAEEAQRLAEEEEERLFQEEAERIQRENTLLRAQVSALNENISFLEECIVEMAEIVYQ